MVLALSIICRQVRVLPPVVPDTLLALPFAVALLLDMALPDIGRFGYAMAGAAANSKAATDSGAIVGNFMGVILPKLCAEHIENRPGK
jgi:hypothetical protein